LTIFGLNVLGAIVLVFILFVLWLGWRASREQNDRDFFAAGRRLGKF
jgi:Na+/proline symporter